MKDKKIGSVIAEYGRDQAFRHARKKYSGHSVTNVKK